MGYYFEKEEIFVKEMAVLVAVSIPIFTRQLEKSREATDKANMRAAKAAVVTAMLDGQTTGTGTYYYDAAQGIIVNGDVPDTVKYGAGTTVEGSADNTGDGYNAKHDYKGGHIEVTIKDNKGTLTGTLKWVGCAAKDTCTVGGKDAFSTPTTSTTGG